MNRAQIVFERHVSADPQHGPSECGRVGFRIDERVFWVENFYFPGTPTAEYRKAVDFATEIADAINAAENSHG